MRLKNKSLVGLFRQTFVYLLLKIINLRHCEPKRRQSVGVKQSQNF